MSKNEVTLENAKTWAKKWQTENKYHCNAFLMPAIDLIEALLEMNVLVKQDDGNYSLQNVESSGVRAYMAIDQEIENGYGEKLLLVGTKVDCKDIHRDIIEDEKPSGCDNCDVNAAVDKLNGSGIFDFTSPCPSDCDLNSPLHNL
ncbi:hypothetical protein [Olleya sp. HaHaR_3_96]|uniref:hypothetical protein n=1 Tax=Olleya sp. HaHaR_3_96 TaxID=2745560 RepID=UPI001C4E6A3A|nr:hypothetical protein [Olleya sp. HaHaR_3_96]QXP60340.1 hypothetical protein H0I26_01460 [Olleya sp. HaHaR_3_96]